MSKRKLDISDLRAKVQKTGAELTPLLESEASDSDSSQSSATTSASVRAFRALKQDEENKESSVMDRHLLTVPRILYVCILASLATKSVKKDSYMAEIQNLAGASLMAVGAVLTLLMRAEECDKLLLIKRISDMAKINIAIHHSISATRKANIFIPDLSPQVAGLIKKAEMDETLYGNDLGERIKESKALTRLSQEIKQKPASSTPKKPFLLKAPAQRKPFSAHTGNYQNKAQAGPSQTFRSKHQYSNKRSYKNNETSRREK